MNTRKERPKAVSEAIQKQSAKLEIVERGMDDLQVAIEERLTKLTNNGELSAEDRGIVAAWFLRSKAHVFSELKLKLNYTDERDWRNGLAAYAALYSVR
jgi:hypothetical protein